MRNAFKVARRTQYWAIKGIAKSLSTWERRYLACMICAVARTGILHALRLAGWKSALPGLRNRIS